MTDDTRDNKPANVVDLFSDRHKQTIPAPPSIHVDTDDEDTTFNIPKPSPDDYLGFIHVFRYLRRLSISHTVSVTVDDDAVTFTVTQNLPGSMSEDEFTERHESFTVATSTIIDFEGIDIPESEEDYSLTVDLAVDTVDNALDILLTPVEHNHGKTT